MTALKQLDSGKWQSDIQPGGRSGKRVRKSFKTKAEALAWERHVQAKVQAVPDWSPPKKDARLLSTLVELWFTHHGSGLRSGIDTNCRLLAMCEAMGNPRAANFTVDVFAEYRTRRITAGITQNNMNREQSYLRAVFNELSRLGLWKGENPLQNLRAFKIQERELSYLTKEQITELLSALRLSQNKHVTLTSKVCLSTGARWGEAEGLRASQVRNGIIQFAQTKSGKTRAVPITPALEIELLQHYKDNGIGDRLFAAAHAAFREAVNRAKLTLPTGQLTHVLRHTFASHFMMNGGNILALQKVLGHQSLTMTLRYAHLSPEHLQEARQLNPLEIFGIF